MPADSFKKIEVQFSKELPFVVYRKPKENTVNAIFQKDDDLHFLKDYSATGFVFAPFQEEKESVLLNADEVFEVSDFLPKKLEWEGNDTLPEGKNKKDFHVALVRKGMAQIEKGNFDKIVLSRSLKTKSETSPLVLFQRLLGNYTNAFCYLWYHPKVGMWLGATPEILLMVRNRTFTTMSLAGTQPYSGENNPHWGRKELEEQELVTNYILEALKGKVDELRRTKVESVRAGNLMHLRTKILGSMPKSGLRTVVEALHPTPAVCGLPKAIAKEFILQNENYEREFYTGYLGELNFKSSKQRSSRRANQENQAYRSISNTTTLFVNLRCVQLKDDAAHIYVGGGITKDSDAEKEWEETVSKSKTMLHIL